MSNKRILKAYERFDYNGKVVPGSLVLRDRIPKNGKSELTGTITWGDGEVDPISLPSDDFRYNYNHTFPNPGLFSGTICVTTPSRLIQIDAEIND